MDRSNLVAVVGKYRIFITSAIIALTTLIFMRPYDWYIFGTDSYSFFNPFYYSTNPLFSFNNGIENLYLSAIVQIFDSLFHNVPLAERLLAVLGTFVSLVGLSDLLLLTERISGKRVHSFFVSIPSLVFYVYNPYTLTVTWPHFLTWSISLIIAPFVLSFCIYTVYVGFDLKRFSVTSLILIVLSPAISGSMLPFFLIVMGISAVFVIFRLVAKKITLKFALRSVLTLALLTASVTVCTFIPLYLSPIFGTPASYSQDFLLQYFVSESSNTSIMHVLTMLGFNVVSPGSLSYPWIGLLSLIREASFILLIFLLMGMIALGMKKPLPLLGIVAFLSVVFSVGANFPFGFINRNLLFMRGPFLFIVNAYYLVIQYYVVFLAILLYAFIGKLTHVIASADPRSGNIARRIRTVTHSQFARSAIAVAVAIIIILGVFLYPFADSQVYQQKGDYIDLENIEDGIPALDQFLSHNFSSPNYLTILFPMSSFEDRTNLLYNNNSTFADSTGLIRSIDPYPLLWNDNSNISAAVENYFSSGHLRGLDLVLHYLHVKYIIFAKNFQKISYMETSPNGHYYNISGIYAALCNEVGAPRIFGNFSVFKVTNVTGTVGIISDPLIINASLATYLDFLGTLNPSTLSRQITLQLENAVTANSTSENVTTIQAFDGNFQGSVKSGGALLGTNESGNIFEIPDRFYSLNGSDISVGSAYAGNISSTNFTSNMIEQSGIIYSNYGSFLSANKNFSAPMMVSTMGTMNMKYENEPIYISATMGNLTVNTEFLKLGAQVDIQIGSIFQGLNYYVGENEYVPLNFINGTMLVNQTYYTNNTLSISIKNVNSNASVSFYFYYGRNNSVNDPIHVQGNFPGYDHIPNRLKFGITVSNNGDSIKIYNISFYYLPDISYIFYYDHSGNLEVMNTSVRMTFFGNMDMTTSYKISVPNAYLYMFNLPQGEWTISLNGHYAANVVYGSEGSVSGSLNLPINNSNSGIQLNYVSPDPFFVALSLVEFSIFIAMYLYVILYSRIKGNKTLNH